MSWCAGCSGSRMGTPASGPFVSCRSAQAEAAGHQDMHQRYAWGNYEAKPRIHLARMEDAGSLLAYRQSNGIDLYDIIDGRSSNAFFVNERREQDDLYEERRLYTDSGSFDEYAEALMPRRAKIGYPSKGPAGEPFPLRASGSGRLTIEYTGKAGAGTIEQARSPISAPDLYDVSGKDHRRPEVAGSGGAITQRDEEQDDAITRTALARTSDSGRKTPGAGTPSHISSPVPALPATDLPQEMLKGGGENGPLNEPQQQIPSITEKASRKNGTDRQEVTASLLSTASQPSDAGRSAAPLLFAEMEGTLLIGFPVPFRGPLVLRDPAGSAPLAEEGQAAQPSSLASLADQDAGEGGIYAEPASEGAPGPAPATADPAPAAKTDGRRTPSSVLKMDVSRKDGPRERSGGVLSLLAASPDSAPGQNKIYRGIPTARLDAVTREDRDVSESGRRWWGKNFYAR